MKTVRNCRPAASLLLSLAIAACTPAAESPIPDPTMDPVPPDGSPTYYRDVKPVIVKRCQGCHEPGSIGPFPLVTYDDAKGKAALLAESVLAKRMPPWKPGPDCQQFAPDRRLLDSEIALFQAWAKAGAPEGNKADDKTTAPTVLSLPNPSATLDWGAAYTPDATKSDDYHCLLIDPKLTQDQDLVAYEFAPDQRHEVHHALIYSAPMADAKAKEDATPGLGWPCSGSSDVKSAQLVATWVPGETYSEYPAGTGIRIPAGHALIAQMHYNLRHGSAPDRSQLKLRYADRPVPNRASIVPILNTSFTINPHQQGAAAVATSGALPVALKVWGVFPHMHELGRSGKVVAGNNCLIDIPKWDFHWQQMFFYAGGGLTVPKGTEVKYTCTWDNPTDRTVRWGEGTEDEMCIAFFYTTLH